MIRGRSLLLGRKLALRHFEAGQKLDVALLASRAALADAEFLLGCPKLRPAFVSSFLASVSSFVQEAGPPMAEPAVSALQFWAISKAGNRSAAPA
jgi:hypothetical protein